MNKLVWTLAFEIAMAGPAAHADTSSAAIGNAIVVNYSEGAVVRYYFNEDQTFTTSWSEKHDRGHLGHPR